MIASPFFIHIPRTGGTYTRHMIKTIGGVDYGHCYIIEGTPNNSTHPIAPKNKIIGYHSFFYQKDLCDYTTMSIVRNIFDWYVSFFIFWKQDLTQREVDKRFEPWILDIIENGLRDGERVLWPSSGFLFPQLFSDTGNFVCDWICRTETLDSDLTQLAKACGAEAHIPLPPIHTSKKRKDYRYYYNNRMVDLINDVYARELKLFGYQFDKIECDPDNKLQLHIQKNLKDSMKYNYTSDKLTVRDI